MPQTDNRRRRRTLPRWLPALLLLAAIVWSAIWALAAWQANRWVDGAFADLTVAGSQIRCADRQTSGYPARLALHCDALTLRDESAGLTVSAAAVQAETALARPGLLITRPRAPVSIGRDRSGAPVVLRWTDAQFATLWRFAGFSGSDSAVTGLVAAWADGRFTAERFTAHLGPSEDPGQTELVIAADAAALQLADTAAVPMAAKARVHLDRPLADLRTGRLDLGAEPARFPRIEVSLTIAEASLDISGTAVIEQSGYLDAELVLAIRGLPALQAALAGLPPSVAATAGPLIGAVVALAGQEDRDGETVHTLPLIIRDGNLRAGPLPIARIPPLHGP